MNPIAAKLNETLRQQSPGFYRGLSHYGRRLFFPRGILAQTQEAKDKAHRFNATIGIAKQAGAPMHLKCSYDLLSSHFEPDEIYPYAPSLGLMELRQMWAQHQAQANPSLPQKYCTLPIVTNGLTHGLSIAGQIFIDPDTQLFLNDKLWGNYKMIFANKLQAEIELFELFDSGLTSFNTRSFAQKVGNAKSDKIVVLLNFPNNPTGYSPTESEAEQICSTLKAQAESGKSVIAICDDAYFGLFFEPETYKESLFSQLAGLHPNITAVKIDGCTKELFMWGLRIGFITIGSQGFSEDSIQAVEKKVGGAVRSDISNVSILCQNTALKTLKSDKLSSQKQEKLRELSRRYAAAKKVACSKKYDDCWKVYPFNSGYFLCLKLHNVSAENLRSHILKEFGVGVIAVQDKDVRVAFSCIEEGSLEEIFDFIAKGVRQLS